MHLKVAKKIELKCSHCKIEIVIMLSDRSDS